MCNPESTNPFAALKVDWKSTVCPLHKPHGGDTVGKS